MVLITSFNLYYQNNKVKKEIFLKKKYRKNIKKGRMIEMLLKIYDTFNFVDDNDDMLISIKKFDRAKEIEEDLKKNEGRWAELYNNDDLIFSGNFDQTFLIEEFY